MPVSVAMVIESDELMAADEVRVVLVVLPYWGVTELKELEEIGLNVSEEPWAQVVKRAKRRKMARHCSPPELRINMTGFSGLTDIVKDRIGNDSYYKVGSSGRLNEMSSNE